jgi:NAD(P)-dependent dehydrogenase (short-subunit alcohol dehydrogenase family)
LFSTNFEHRKSFLKQYLYNKKTMNKVWLITGCSTGFGRELSKAVIANGDKVAVTARKVADVNDIVAGNEANAIALTLDVTKQAEIDAAAKVTVDKFGRIDVLVNNAGIGYFGAVEESEEEQVRRMFDINVFGLGNMTKAVLPTMRSQKSGHVVNVSSIGGLRSFPAVGYYNATKYAVDGLSEALAKEVAPLGIKVTIICPSGFRTDWAGRSADNSNIVIADYATTAEANKNNIRGISGNQPGDPVKAALAIIKVTETENPPLRLLLGEAAYNGAKLKLEELRNDFETWKDTSIGADFPKGE